MKLVDIWMVYCILTLFLVVVSVVIIQCIQVSIIVNLISGYQCKNGHINVYLYVRLCVFLQVVCID